MKMSNKSRSTLLIYDCHCAAVKDFSSWEFPAFATCQRKLYPLCTVFKNILKSGVYIQFQFCTLSMIMGILSS